MASVSCGGRPGRARGAGWAALLLAAAVPAAGAAAEKPAGPPKLPLLSNERDSLVLPGATRDTLEAAIGKALAEKLPGLEPSALEVKLAAREMARRAQEDDRRKAFVVSGREYNSAAERFNTYQDMVAMVGGLDLPADFKKALRQHYAQAIIVRRRECFVEDEQKLLSAIPKGSRCFTVGEGGTAGEFIRQVYPEFGKLSVMGRRCVYDRLAKLNPYFRRAGCYRADRDKIDEDWDYVPLPTYDRRWVQVCLYRAEPNSLIIIPPADSLAEGLATADLRRAWIGDLSLLEHLPLRDLNAAGTKVADLSPLKGMPLETLDLLDTAVSDLKPLAGMKLTSLNIAGTKVADLSPLKHMPLETLRANGTAAADLSPLKGMPLETLDLAGTAVSDLKPLAGMKLTSLNVAGTKVADLSPLKGMKLASLNVADTGVTDLSVLKGATLEELRFSEATVKAGLDIVRGMGTLKTINGRSASSYWAHYERIRKSD